MSWSGAVIGTVINIMTNVRRKAWLRIPLDRKPVRTVCFVAGAGATAPGAVGRILGATAPPMAGTTLLASAWSSSRSQLAAHSGFDFERQGRTNILVSGVEGRNAARQNVLETTDYRNDHQGGPIYKKRGSL